MSSRVSGCAVHRLAIVLARLPHIAAAIGPVSFGDQPVGPLRRVRGGVRLTTREQEILEQSPQHDRTAALCGPVLSPWDRLQRLVHLGGTLTLTRLRTTFSTYPGTLSRHRAQSRFRPLSAIRASSGAATCAASQEPAHRARTRPRAARSAPASKRSTPGARPSKECLPHSAIPTGFPEP